MRHSQTRGLAGLERHGLAAAAARLAVFLAVEGIARACGLRLDRAFQGLGFAGHAFAATVAMVWVFEAHRRYTFRDRRMGEGLEGGFRFVAASWACLVVGATTLRFAPDAATAAWLAATLLKFAFVRRWTWNRGALPREAQAT